MRSFDISKNGQLSEEALDFSLEPYDQIAVGIILILKKLEQLLFLVK